MENKVDYSYMNAANVLAKLEPLIKYGISRDIRTVYRDLSIFDWWSDRLTITQMKQMKSFLKLALELGYTGYVAFKVGASGCANGMWACKKVSTDGYTPKGPTLYRSFSPDYTYYQFRDENNVWFPMDTKEEPYDHYKTMAQFKKYFKNFNK